MLENVCPTVFDVRALSAASPITGMMLDSLTNCVVANHVLHRAAIEHPVLESGRLDNCSVMNNMGVPL